MGDPGAAAASGCGAVYRRGRGRRQYARRFGLYLPWPHDTGAPMGFALAARRAGALLAAAVLAAAPARACVVNAFASGSETLYLKWGDNHAGTLGGTVYWSFIPPGTPGSATYCGDACPGNSASSI